MVWAPRIRFGGLLDIPDSEGETRSQGPCAGLAVSLFDPESPEPSILNLQSALVKGHLPEKKGEILISDDFANGLDVRIGDTATLIGSTMYGSMAGGNFTIAGTIRFGITVLDRGAMIADLSDIQAVLDMEDAAGEILGFFKNGVYLDKKAESMTAGFNREFQESDEFAPVMVSLRNQNGLTEILDLIKQMAGIIIGVFIVIMSLVLWNAGLRGSLRRYGEIGVRLAIGEDKRKLYLFMMAESLVIGFASAILGTAAGLAFSYLLQVKGINVQSMMQNSTMLTSSVMRARITPASFYIGFIPGLFSTFLGTAISGIGIYKRETSQLFKELEV
jgi:putative ABC transport system permease protein